MVSAHWKRNRRKDVAHYFGHREVIEWKGRANKRDLSEIVRYVMQEGSVPCAKWNSDMSI